jgi:hypothetical protein
VSCDKTNCVISLGLTIMDRCAECEKRERVAEEEERIVRNRAFAERLSHIPGVIVSDTSDDGRTLREFVEPRDAQKTPLPCGCNKPHEPNASFFVSCIEDEGKRRNSFLLGPYTTHAEALANVERGRDLAVRNDPKAYWYSFGTCAIVEPTGTKGVFGK